MAIIEGNTDVGGLHHIPFEHGFLLGPNTRGGDRRYLGERNIIAGDTPQSQGIYRR